MMARLRNYFLAGLVIAAPVMITIWLTWTAIAWVDSWVRPLIPERYSPETYLRFTIPGFGLIVALIGLTLIGFFAANIIGRSVLGYGERLVGRIPLARAVYRAVKQIFESILRDRSNSFQRVGLIEFPRRGMWCIGFVSTETKGEIPHLVAEPGERMWSVFVPPTPAPTAGFLLFVKEQDIIFLDMTVEDAAKVVISMGLVTPAYVAKTTELAAGGGLGTPEAPAPGPLGQRGGSASPEKADGGVPAE